MGNKHYISQKTTINIIFLLLKNYEKINDLNKVENKKNYKVYFLFSKHRIKSSKINYQMNKDI